MNFDELVAEVVDITKRPDLTTFIQSRVRAAVLKAHTKDFYYRDIVEQAIVFDNPATNISFQPKDLYPRFRKSKYVRLWNYDETDSTNFGSAGPYLKSTQLGNLKDNYGYDKTEIYYMAGNLLQLRSRSTISHILFGHFQYPVVTSDGFDSWIAEEFPGAIYTEAARTVFKSIGLDAESSEQNALAQEEYQILVINNIPSEGE